MIWPKEISFEGYSKKKDEWFNDPDHFLGDPPISAQYSLNLIFKTLVDDKENYPYLTTVALHQEGVDRNDHARNITKEVQQEVSCIFKEAKKGKA